MQSIGHLGQLFDMPNAAVVWIVAQRADYSAFGYISVFVRYWH